MLKAVAVGTDHTLIILGLSDENVARILEDDPVLFNLSELGLEDKWCCISAKRPDGTAALPADFNPMIGIAMMPDVLRKLEQQPQRIEYEKYRFFLFGGKDEDAMAEHVLPLVVPQTEMLDSRPPQQKRPFPN